eukprot:227316-Chlamydomonas_euryale.AAC.1
MPFKAACIQGAITLPLALLAVLLARQPHGVQGHPQPGTQVPVTPFKKGRPWPESPDRITTVAGWPMGL